LQGRLSINSQPAILPPDSNPAVKKNPELIVVLGCRGEKELRERVEAALYVVKHMKDTSSLRAIVLSGGGDGQITTEARRMLQVIKSKPGTHIEPKSGMANWFALEYCGRSIDVALEEDSLDTLGNAVFSWLTLKLTGERFGLTGSTNRLERLLLVTNGMHAPRSHDIFRRVFAFRSALGVNESPEIVVRAVNLKPRKDSAALDNLRSEAIANNETFRLVNPLTNGYDPIANGHVRSILGQMLRLHELYKNRWDLVRKYQACWTDA
jgi:hypothetical protein